MKYIYVIFILITSLLVNAKNSISENNFKMDVQEIQKKIDKLENENMKLNKLIYDLDFELKHFNSILNQLTKKNDSLNIILNQATLKLKLQITNSESNVNRKIEIADNNLRKYLLWGIIVLLILLIISGTIYLIINRKLSIGKYELICKIRNTRSEISKEISELEIQLLELIEKQLKVADKISKIESTTDHTFHKNSANEMQKIANYVNTLDIDSQEAIALSGSIERLRNYFKSSEYEIIEFRNIDFDDRIPMRVKETNYDESLPKGKEIITRTLKPQIKYKGQVIQDPEVITKYNN